MELALLEKAYELIPNALVIVDKEGKICLVNTQAEILLGYTRRELKGQPIEILVPTKLRVQHTQHRVEFMDNPHVRPMGVGLELHALKKDRTRIPVEISLSPIDIEQNLYTVATIQNISSHRQEISILRNRWKWLISCVIILHLFQGVLLTMFESAANTTSTASLLNIIPNHIVAGLLLIGVAISAFVGLIYKKKTWLFLPQMGILAVATMGAISAMSSSQFADGVVRPRPFIMADQGVYIILTLIYGIVLLERFTVVSK